MMSILIFQLSCKHSKLWHFTGTSLATAPYDEPCTLLQLFRVSSYSLVTVCIAFIEEATTLPRTSFRYLHFRGVCVSQSATVGQLLLTTNKQHICKAWINRQSDTSRTPHSPSPLPRTKSCVARGDDDCKWQGSDRFSSLRLNLTHPSALCGRRYSFKVNCDTGKRFAREISAGALSLVPFWASSLLPTLRPLLDFPLLTFSRDIFLDNFSIFANMRNIYSTTTSKFCTS